MEFKNIVEFAECLRSFGYEESLVHDILDHESAHVSAAVQLEGAGSYRMTFKKTKEGNIIMLPSAIIAPPEGISPEEWKDFDAVVTSAPKVLSGSDLQRLKKY